MLNLELQPQDFEGLLTQLKETAEKGDPTKRFEKMKRVDSLLIKFMDLNKERAEHNFEERKPTINPVKAHKEKIATILIDMRDPGPTKVSFKEEVVPTTTQQPFKVVEEATEKEKGTFSELLGLPGGEEIVENHLLQMIMDDPEEAAETLSNLFEHESVDDQLQTKNELKDLMAKDPLAVTSAFSDLIQNQTERPIPEPPKAVQGQLLRMTEKKKPIRMRLRTTTRSSTTTSATTTATKSVTTARTPPVTTRRPKPRTTTTASRTSPFRDQRPEKNLSTMDLEFPLKKVKPVEDEERVTDEVLEAMLHMIESGDISSETVIQEMINNGILPVEVTDVGKLPITVGRQVLEDFATSRETKDRESVSLKRLQQLRVRQPSLVMKDDRHHMVDVDIDDPTFDVEVLGKKPLARQEKTTTAAPPPEKEINVESSLKELHDQGLISKDELEEMMELISDEPITKRPQKSFGRPERPRQRPRKIKPGSSSIPFVKEQPKSEQPESYSYVEIHLGNKERQQRRKKKKPKRIHAYSTPRSYELATPTPPPVYKTEFFEALKLENPFKDPFDDVPVFTSGAPDFIPPIGELPKPKLSRRRKKPFTKLYTEQITKPIVKTRTRTAYQATTASPVEAKTLPREHPPHHHSYDYVDLPFTPIAESKLLPREPFSPPTAYGHYKQEPRRNKGLNFRDFSPRKIKVISKAEDVYKQQEAILPDFTTVAPFPYETSPRTGSRASDLTIEEIRQSFLRGEKSASFGRSLY